MDAQQQELVEKLKTANNILVTVSSNPSVDQLAACIGMTLLLNKLKKHATAVFSGQVPSTIEFLKPEETLEKNTDSLRDFIISLDKSKADKLRYKVEENVVKIFITPYKTSIGEADLDFSQGDFNVDVVLCLGISQQQDLDQAITAHGRILHDAIVAGVNTQPGGELGTINWVNPSASSLSELAADLAGALGKDLIDGQIATAFLTGIVAETARFSNEKTSPNAMKLSAELMAAGANQQLVANELQNSSTTFGSGVASAAPADAPADGTLEIGHPVEGKEPNVPPEEPDSKLPEAADKPSAPSENEADPNHTPASRLILQPPSLGGTLTANSQPEEYDPSIDPLTMLNGSGGAPMLSHVQDSSAVTDPDAKTAEPTPLELPDVAPPQPDKVPAPAADPVSTPTFEPLPSEPIEVATKPASPASDQLLTDIEEAVHSPHLEAEQKPAMAGTSPSLDTARSGVEDALNSVPPSIPQPKESVGASGYLNVQDLPGITDGLPPENPAPNEPAPNASSPADQPMNMPLPPSLNLPPADPTPPTSSKSDPSAPPPVPPPLPPSVFPS